jgi:tetratricopeptide (TPR) repeat protein
VASRKPKHPEATDTIAEIESKGERALEWVAQNIKPVLGVIATCLLVAGAYSYYDSARERRENAASEAVAEARSDYLVAMGAAPGAIVAPELANPAAGVQIRQEFAERFRAIAEEHPGTAGAAIAQLEQGDLAAAGGEVEHAFEIWRSAVAGLPDSSPLAGLLHQRIAQSLEDLGDWEEAAAAYAAAAALDAYTFRHWAMAEAARCYLMADRPERALELFSQL